MGKIVGIYKITSPTGKAYIGQSWDIKKRWSAYNNLKCKTQCRIYNSLLSHTPSSHLFEIIHELPGDVDQEVLDRFEGFYIAMYRDAGVELLNLMTGRSCGQHSQETKDKIGEKNKGRKVNAYQVQRIKETHIGKIVTKETRHRQSIALKGKGGFFGKSHSAAWRKAAAERKTGTTHTDESKRKMSFAKMGNANRLGKSFSDESKKKISEGRKGKRMPQESINRMKEKLKGRVFTPEWKQKISDGQRGRKLSEETKEKIRQANLGKKASEETKLKMSETRKNKL